MDLSLLSLPFWLNAKSSRVLRGRAQADAVGGPDWVLAVPGGGVSPALAAAPAGPLSGCLPSPDSTHFSEPRKHNEPGRSADPHHEFKVAICLQLPFPRKL